MSDNKQSEQLHKKHHPYWVANLKLIAMLLSIWAFVSVGCCVLLIDTLNKITIGQIPFGFWMAQQGTIYIFVILIFVYAWQMDKLDKRYGHKEPEKK